MTKKRHVLVIDPIAFPGGSKTATETILNLLEQDNVRITVLTRDPDSWQQPNINRALFQEPKWLSQQEQGIPYFLRHLFILLKLFLARLHYGKIDIAIGASGPGVDLALYLARPLLRYKIMQLIHGPVASSRTIGRCLQKASQIYYLEHTKHSIKKALATVSRDFEPQLPVQFQVMENGLPSESWPKRCQTSQPIVFWAASLLKWKGLETLLDALNIIAPPARPKTHICYIQPKETLLPVSQAPITMTSVHWHKSPENLNQLRASANIFVSTSKNEPFGLSILEAMAAGHCVVIPADGAYWDKILEDGISCIKYQPGDSMELATKLWQLCRDMDQVRKLGASAHKIALHYQADISYAPIKQVLEGSHPGNNSHALNNNTEQCL